MYVYEDLQYIKLDKMTTILLRAVFWSFINVATKDSVNAITPTYCTAKILRL